MVVDTSRQVEDEASVEVDRHSLGVVGHMRSDMVEVRVGNCVAVERCLLRHLWSAWGLAADSLRLLGTETYHCRCHRWYSLTLRMRVR